MDEDEKIEEFREIEAELFKPVEAGFTAYKTEEGAVGIKWKNDGPRLKLWGLGQFWKKRSFWTSLPKTESRSVSIAKTTFSNRTPT